MDWTTGEMEQWGAEKGTVIYSYTHEGDTLYSVEVRDKNLSLLPSQIAAREAKKPSKEQIAKQQQKEQNKGGSGGGNNDKDPKKKAEQIANIINGGKKLADDVIKRIQNTTQKTEFMEKVKQNYIYDKPTGAYRLKDNGTPIIDTRTGQQVKYIEWDGQHGDVEAWASKTKHLGSLDPKTNQMYKGPASDGRTLNQ